MLKISANLQGNFFKPKVTEQIIYNKMVDTVEKASLILETDIYSTLPEGATKNLKRGLRVILSGTKNPFYQRVQSILSYFGYAENYGTVVEYGRSRGAKMPPQGVLINWIMHKIGLSAKKAARAEYVFRRAIKEHPGEGKFTWTRSLLRNLPKIRVLFAKIGADITSTIGR